MRIDGKHLPSSFVPLLAFGVAAAWLPGCGECQPWDEMRVDASGLADPDPALAQFQDGLDQFIAWTGRDTTCVERVELVPELVGVVAGQYDSVARRIELEDVPAPVTTVHEFCHALDHEEASEGKWASEYGAELLQPYTVGLDEELYPGEVDRTHEAFARFCAQGPALTALLEELNRACGIEGPLEASRFVRDIAFPDTDVSVEWSELDASFAFDTSTIAVPDSRREADSAYTSAVAGAAGIFVLEHLITEDVVVSEAIAPQLLLLNPDSFAILDTLALAPHGPVLIGGNPAVSAHALVGSTTAPILYQRAGDDPGLAWRVETSPLRLEPVSWPTMEEGFSPVGFEKGGVALVRSGGAVLRVDLTAGTVQQAGGDDASAFDPSRAEAFSADATGAVGAYATPTGLALVQLDWSGEGALVADLPVPTTHVRSLFRLSDGTIVVTATVEGTAAVTGGASLAISLRYDPVAGTWASAEGDCDGLAGEGWVTGHGAPLRVEAVEEAERSFALQVVALHL
jgi:hypothetical protein